MFKLCEKMLVVIGFVLCLFSPVFAYSGGSGEPNNPYQIASVADWQSLMSRTDDWNKPFIMIADVNLQGVTLTPVGTSTAPFTGIFNGDGYIISNAVINGGTPVGLFGRTGATGLGGQIYNLGVEDINIVATGNYVGGLVGRHYGYIAECYVTGSVTGSTSGSSYVGGIVGGNYGTILNSFSTCNVKGKNYAGGLLGSNSVVASDVNTCYSTGLVTAGGANVGGLCGYNYGAVSVSVWDVNTSGKSTSFGGTPKTTAQMKTLTTFTSIGWDFFGETTNGTDDIWRMCVNGVYYPKLYWQFSLGDFVCLDGVTFKDFAWFAQRWKMTNCGANNDCDGADMEIDGTVNFLDFAIFAENWLEGI